MTDNNQQERDDFVRAIVEGVTKRLNAIELKVFSSHEDNFKAASERFAAIEANLDGLHGTVRSVTERIGELEDRHDDEDEAAASLVDGIEYDEGYAARARLTSAHARARADLQVSAEKLGLKRYKLKHAQQGRPDFDPYEEICDRLADDRWLTVTTRTPTEIYLAWTEEEKQDMARCQQLADKVRELEAELVQRDRDIGEFIVKWKPAK